MPIFIGRGAPLTPEYAAVAGIIQGDATILRPTGRIAPHLRLLPISGTIRYVQYEWTMAKPPRIFVNTAWIFPIPLQPSKTRTALKRSIDTRFVYDEERVQVIGVVRGKVLFVIVTLPGEDTCRIISARKATRHEQARPVLRG